MQKLTSTLSGPTLNSSMQLQIIILNLNGSSKDSILQIWILRSLFSGENRLNSAEPNWSTNTSIWYFVHLWEEPCKPATSFSEIIQANPESSSNLNLGSTLNQLVILEVEWNNQWKSLATLISPWFKTYKPTTFTKYSMKKLKLRFSTTWKVSKGKKGTRELCSCRLSS